MCIKPPKCVRDVRRVRKSSDLLRLIIVEIFTLVTENRASSAKWIICLSRNWHHFTPELKLYKTTCAEKHLPMPLFFQSNSCSSLKCVMEHGGDTPPNAVQSALHSLEHDNQLCCNIEWQWKVLHKKRQSILLEWWIRNHQSSFASLCRRMVLWLWKQA